MKPLFQRKLSLSLLLAIAPVSISQVAFAQSAKTAPARSSSWIRVQASTNKAQYNAGEPIKVTLKATNIQSRDAYLKYSSGQRFELRLFKIDQNFAGALGTPKEPIYTWSADKNFIMATSHVKLKSGQSETYQGEIDGEMGALKPGIYRLEAQLSNSSQISAPPISFVVTAKADAPDVTSTATTDKRVYQIGETVKINFSIQNNTSAPMKFDFNSGQTYDVYVRDAVGEAVWNWSANKRFAMAIRQVTLKAGEKQDFSVEWDGSALPDREIKPGKYTVEAVYTANPAVKAAPVEIEIR